MYTMSKIEKKGRRGKISFSPLVGCFIALAIITSAARFALNFRPLYYFDLDYLNIPEQSGYSREEIVKNYDVLVDYLRPSYKGELHFPTFPMSAEAKQHFVEVKDLFTAMNYIMYAAIILSILGIIIYIIKRNNRFLKWASIFLILLPVLLAVPFAVNFDKTFDIFHMIFFRNDYWLFDPTTDPIINVLPQAFFMHAGMLILSIITLGSLLLYIIYRKTKRREPIGYW
jgi:integral membrane protein (TIGR01906 family)